MKCGLVEATAVLVEGLCTSFRWLFRFFENAISAILSMTTIKLFVFFNSYYIFCFSSFKKKKKNSTQLKLRGFI